MAIDQNIEEFLIMGDSNLIIRQSQRECETRDVKLIPYKKHVEDLNKRFKSIEFRYIPRCHNELADALATLASMLLYPDNAHIDPLEIQIRESHGYCNTIKAAPNTQPWYHDIKKFLKTQEYPEQAVTGHGSFFLRIPALVSANASEMEPTIALKAPNGSV
uniref:Uncharacterized protein LOC104241320 n=1 Tax=Nicotiana sylvestris TaxID=4096 RepID=A0A1U7Y5Q4_NICSY|nr:PREDICTED: uncharacterized protein LOC104241320 [Nicotiana sylvestris]